MGRLHIQKWLLVLLVLLSQSSSSQGWFFSSTTNSKNDNKQENSKYSSKSRMVKLVSEFSMEVYKNEKGLKLIENAKQKMLVPDSCWQRAYQSVFAVCSKALPDEELRSRLSWNLCDCFQQHTGRSPLPYCDAKSPMTNCLKKIDTDVLKIYLEFLLEIGAICHQLQMDAWKFSIESLVNNLQISAEFAEEKLENMLQVGELLLQNSKNVQESLASIDVRTQQVVETSKNIEDSVNSVSRQSEAILEQSKGIAASQLELSEGQAIMKETLQENMAMVHESYSNLDHGINRLVNGTEEIENKIVKVGDEMTSRMEKLQTKADDIGNIAGQALDKQKQLLDGQSEAINGLELLTKTQSQAMEESRGTLQQLAQFGHEQQEELLKRQKQLQQTHDHLVEKSKTILAAQETFESKQASMFLAIDKLFALHNAMLLESRLIKAFLLYSLSIFLIYMFTSTKQTYNVRPRLYIGLCLTFLIEVAILRYGTSEIDDQAWTVSIVRSLFVLLASCQLLYSIWTYRDYEVLNHQMLLTLVEKVNGIQKQKKYLSYEMENEDSDSDVDWCSWIEAELPEDVDKLKDPDFVYPEEVAENSVGNMSITRRYNLRNHHLLTN
ncbi:PREDICTED: protein GAMETE EXPRESSED 1 [Nicotiana attenuata]|uniref:Protein gamete expressed 1 n=1 Tax=Nicotiana attenuata TaxID=49451 RepID=A0A1J6KB93_NICAT|nr:PREDICTED: protein GAMETE EXPRESSED 1 [Nicotiana attenuata]OIT27341.1 protein gamete expressed 1 [Nicotiana attenuata]